VRRRRRRRWWLGVALAAAVSMPFALAALAHTSVPPAQTQPPIEPLPTSGRPGDLGSEIDHVPLFSAVPDVASRAAVDAYRRARIFDADDAKAAFVAAWGALRVPPEARSTVDQFAADLLDPTTTGDLPDRADRVFDALGSDTDNGVRLTNAAVMLFGYAALVDSEIAAKPEGADYPYGWHVESMVVRLLDEVADRFGPSREQTLNQAVYVSLIGSSPGTESAEDLASAVLEADPVM
jgi:hypothetical protein